MSSDITVIQYERFIGPKENFVMVFYLDVIDLQYNSQNAKVPMGPKRGQLSRYLEAALMTDVLITAL